MIDDYPNSSNPKLSGEFSNGVAVAVLLALFTVIIATVVF